MSQASLFDHPSPRTAPAHSGAIAVGARVRVAILGRDGYAVGCTESLDGKTGVVEEMKDVDHCGVPQVPRCLVRFDEPAAPWWTNQLSVAAFWFDAVELVAK